MAGGNANISGVAGRYASALFDLARDAGSIDVVAGDLAGVATMMNDSADLRDLIKSPLYDRDDQTKAMAALLERAGANDLTKKFVGLVVANRRLFALDGIIGAYKALVAQHRGEVSAEVTSAHPLTDAQVQKLTETLKAATGSEVTLSTKVDNGLLGGLVVKLGSRMVDTSLRSKLNRMKLAMKEAG
ncbi:F0F1 ATP synthase subunit delta [Pyruvatibacter sp.]|uniref:F0F1 ATP synthase subunit delta n=1 Tax=Pyruvatibacter sp. TaxID=1981328 RepID=UPI0032F0157B